MLLVILSIIGISSTNTAVTENFIVRNTAIRQQNLHLVDSVALEAYQVIIDAAAYDNPDDPDEFIDFQKDLHHANLSSLIWFHDIDAWENGGNEAIWYNPASRRLLDITNSEVPQSILNGTISLIDDRGEWDGNADSSPVRYAFAGWRQVEGGGESIAQNKPGMEVIEIGHIFVEYVSARSGVIRLVVGLKTRTG